MLASFEVPPSGTGKNIDPAKTTEEGLHSQTGGGRVAACIDASGFAAKVISHALAVAAALGSPITLIQVLEAKPVHPVPLDPVEWDIRLREARHEVLPAS